MEVDLTRGSWWNQLPWKLVELTSIDITVHMEVKRNSMEVGGNFQGS